MNKSDLTKKINKELGHPIMNLSVREEYISKLIDEASSVYDDELGKNLSMKEAPVKDLFITRYVKILVKEDLIRFNRKFKFLKNELYNESIEIDEKTFIKQIEKEKEILWEIN